MTETSDELELKKLRLDITSLELAVARHIRRDDAEYGALIADRNLKERQHTTEIWKVVLATVVATAVFGGFAVTLATYLLSSVQ